MRSRRRRPRSTAPGPFSYFFYIVLPHIARAITVVILIETIFLLSVFAEICVTTNGGRRRDHQHSLPRLQAGAAQLRRRRRLGGRHRRGRARQHRRVLPGPHHRQEPGGLNHGAEAIDGQARRHDGRRLGRRLPDLLPDPLDVPDQLQDRARRRSRFRRSSCSSTGRSRITSRCSRARTICCSPAIRSCCRSAPTSSV